MKLNFKQVSTTLSDTQLELEDKQTSIVLSHSYLSFSSDFRKDYTVPREHTTTYSEQKSHPAKNRQINRKARQLTKRKLKQMINGRRQVVGILLHFLFRHLRDSLQRRFHSHHSLFNSTYRIITTIQVEKCDFKASKQDPSDQKTISSVIAQPNGQYPEWVISETREGLQSLDLFSLFWLVLGGEKMVGIFSRLSKSGLRRLQSTLVSNSFYLQRSLCKSPCYRVRFLFLI